MMKLLLLKIKNLIPYLILIIIYFLFVNIEARNSKINNNKTTINNTESSSNKSEILNSNIRINIPVIPYGQ